jgi:hypothetical protein
VGCVWHGQAHGHRGGRSPPGDFPGGGPRGRRGEGKKGVCQPVGGGGVADLGVREGEGEPLERSIPAPNTGAHPLTFAINPNPNPRGVGCNRGHVLDLTLGPAPGGRPVTLALASRGVVQGGHPRPNGASSKRWSWPVGCGSDLDISSVRDESLWCSLSEP